MLFLWCCFLFWLTESNEFSGFRKAFSRGVHNALLVNVSFLELTCGAPKVRHSAATINEGNCYFMSPCFLGLNLCNALCTDIACTNTQARTTPSSLKFSLCTKKIQRQETGCRSNCFFFQIVKLYLLPWETRISASFPSTWGDCSKRLMPRNKSRGWRKYLQNTKVNYGSTPDRGFAWCCNGARHYSSGNFWSGSFRQNFEIW